MTYGGGTGNGNSLRVAPNGSGGWNEQVLYNRGGYSGLAIDSSENLYGADEVEDGHLFKLSRNVSGGWDATILHTFKGGANDGQRPQGTPVLDRPEISMVPRLGRRRQQRWNGLEAGSCGRWRVY